MKKFFDKSFKNNRFSFFKKKSMLLIFNDADELNDKKYMDDAKDLFNELKNNHKISLILVCKN